MPQNGIMLVAIRNRCSCHFVLKTIKVSQTVKAISFRAWIISRSRLACNLCLTGKKNEIRWWNWTSFSKFFLNPTYPKVYLQAFLQTCRQYHICILGYQSSATLAIILLIQLCSKFKNSLPIPIYIECYSILWHAMVFLYKLGQLRKISTKYSMNITPIKTFTTHSLICYKW